MIDKMPMTISVRIVAWASSDPGIVFNNSLIRLDVYLSFVAFDMSKVHKDFVLKNYFKFIFNKIM